MKINQSGQITISKELRERFGFQVDSTIEVEVSKEGILIKPMASHREQVCRWFKSEHQNEMATLTTNQIMHLIH